MNEITHSPGDERVTAWIRQFAEQSLPQEDDSVNLPDPQLLWWKAQALRRLDAERETAAAFDKVETLQITGSIAAAVLLVVALLFAAPGNGLLVIVALVGVATIAACLALPLRETGTTKRLF